MYLSFSAITNKSKQKGEKEAWMLILMFRKGSPLF
nr:MAG TPA: hypothetical protein [Caudoviricetes sp.]